MTVIAIVGATTASETGIGTPTATVIATAAVTRTGRGRRTEIGTVTATVGETTTPGETATDDASGTARRIATTLHGDGTKTGTRVVACATFEVLCR